MTDGTAPKSTWYGRGFTFYRVDSVPGLPRADTQIASMFRVDDDRPPPPALAGIPTDERTALLMSTASTLTRTNYHNLRFASTVRSLAERRSAVGGLLVGDLLSSSALYEAIALLAGSRRFVDEVLYLAARRAGATPEDADRKWSADAAIKADLRASNKYNIPEVAILQSRLAWFEELNAYRNVLVHRGWKDTPIAGYYPRSVQVYESSQPTTNIMLIPDLDSIERPNRANSWTYTRQGRLEDLIERVWSGIEGFATDIGGSWGLAIPPAGTVPLSEQPTMMVVELFPSIVAAFGYTYVPLFSAIERAETFRDQCFGASCGREILPIVRGPQRADRPWTLRLPCGESLILSADVALTDSLKIPLDPEFNSKTGAVLYAAELANASLSALRAHRGPYYNITLTAPVLSAMSTLFYIRGAQP